MGAFFIKQMRSTNYGFAVLLSYLSVVQRSITISHFKQPDKLPFQPVYFFNSQVSRNLAVIIINMDK